MKAVSQRARHFLERPQFFQKALSKKFEVELDQSDRILTVLHSGSPNEVAFVINETLALFAKNKKPLEIWSFSFREIESFLRDENHLSSLEGEASELEDLLVKIKLSLIGQSLKKNFQGTSAPLGSFQKLSLLGKNQWAQSLLSAFCWELVLCEGETLTMKKPPEGFLANELELLFAELLMEEGETFPIKVVAV